MEECNDPDCGLHGASSDEELARRMLGHKLIVHGMVLRDGYAVQDVLGDEDGPSFAYTIGFEDEFIVRGFGSPGSIVRFLVEHGAAMLPLGVHEVDDLDGKKIRFEIIPWSGPVEPFAQAIAARSQDLGEVFGAPMPKLRLLRQVVVADENGLLPREGGEYVHQHLGAPEWRDEYEGRLDDAD